MNGDRWTSKRYADTKRLFVRHEADLPPDGHAIDIDVGKFSECHRMYVVLGRALGEAAERRSALPVKVPSVMIGSELQTDWRL